MTRADVDESIPPTLAGERLLAVQGLVHGFTTRAGPAAGQLGSLQELAGVSWRELSVRQVHGATTWSPGESDDPADRPEADALATRRAGDLLVVHAADCLPVVMAALRGGRAVAVTAAHAGWRGLLAGVLESALRRVRSGGADAVLAALGPCIGRCCFEVGDEVADRFVARFGAEVIAPGLRDRRHVDLQASARRLLADAGVAVEEVAACTRCRPDAFHSYRAAGPGAGRNAAFIGMRP